MRLLADMNISPLTVAALQSEGWDIIRVSEVLPIDAEDVEILSWARSNGRIVITQDLDFSTLLALGGHSEPSLVTLRLGNSDPQTITEALLALLPQVEAGLQTGSAVTVTERAVRVRPLPIQ
jgi:predicted nuclease of predicted toxin-antitoxin system